LGLLPTIVWLGQVSQRFGSASGKSLVGFLLQLGGEDRHGHGLLYYGWNLLANGFPWSAMAVVGAIVVLRDAPWRGRRSLLLGGPGLVLLTLTGFATRLPHYSLLLYPFMAWLAGVGLDDLATALERKDRPSRYLDRSGILILLRGLGVLGAGLGLGAIALGFGNLDLGLDPSSGLSQPTVAVLAAILGGSWWLASWLGGAWGRGRSASGAADYPPGTPSPLGSGKTIPPWIWSLLLGLWITLAGVGRSGVLGNINPGLKAFIRQPTVQQILTQQVVNFSPGEGADSKAEILLRFYTPHLGTIAPTIADLPPGYAWVSQGERSQLPPHQDWASWESWHLVQIAPPDLP